MPTKVGATMAAPGLGRLRHSRWVGCYSRYIPPVQQRVHSVGEPAGMPWFAAQFGARQAGNGFEKRTGATALEFKARRQLDQHRAELGLQCFDAAKEVRHVA